MANEMSLAEEDKKISIHSVDIHLVGRSSRV